MGIPMGPVRETRPHDLVDVATYAVITVNTPTVPELAIG